MQKLNKPLTLSISILILIALSACQNSNSTLQQLDSTNTKSQSNLVTSNNSQEEYPWLAALISEYLEGSVKINLSPTLLSIDVNDSYDFQVSLVGAENNNIYWEITGGTVATNTTQPRYTAPSESGIYTITVVSEEDPNQKASATIIVKSFNEPNNWTSLPNWFTYQGNESHTGYVPVTLDPQKFIVRWVKNFADNGSGLKSVADGNNQVFVTYDGSYSSGARELKLYALNAWTGAENWNIDFTSRDSVNPPAYADGKVYVVTGGHQNSFLWGFDENNGTPILRSPYNNQWSTYPAPTPYGDNIYMSGGSYGGSYAFNGSSGDELWFNADDTLYNESWTPIVDENYTYHYTTGFHYVASENITYSVGVLKAINRLTGLTEFSIPNLQSDGSVNYNSATKTDTNHIIAITDYNDQSLISSSLVNFDVQNRTIAWQHNGSYTGQPSYANNTVYAINGGNLQARSVETGALEWQWIPLEGTLSGNILVTDNLVFVGLESSNSYETPHKTIAIDLNTREVVWEVPMVGDLALANEGILYIKSLFTNDLVAIDVR